MSIKYIKGDLFGAPSKSILAHSCNCQGSWGAGVALGFKAKFPSTYQIYHEFCKTHDTKEILGTCLLIPSASSDPGGEGNYVACLFTSGFSGTKVDSPDLIVENTLKAVNNLLTKLPSNYSQPIYMPKINAGLFLVPWENTEKALIKTQYPFIVYEL